MTTVVWKYELNLFGKLTTFAMPAGATVVHCALQGQRPCIWVQVRQEVEKTEARSFQVFATGEAIPAGAAHIGTIIDGDYVWHAFEVRS